MKRQNSSLLIIIIMSFIVIVGSLNAEKALPCSTPPFLTHSVPPNILLVLDNSGSMSWNAYGSTSGDDISNWSTQNKDYYGYFENDKNYKYNWTYGWFDVTTQSVTAADPQNDLFSGRFLNRICTRRMDIARKVLIGGHIEDRSADPQVRVMAIHNGYSDSYMEHEYWNYDEYDDGCKWRFLTKQKQLKCYLPDDSWCRHQVTGSAGCGWKSWPEKTYNLRIRVPDDDPATGFLQDTNEQAKYALELFNYSCGGVIDRYMGADMDSIIYDINKNQILSQTPLSEVLYEAGLFWSAEVSVHNYIYNGELRNDDYSDQRDYRDYIDYADNDPIGNWCEKNFIIFITDGEPTSDGDIPSWIKDYDNDNEDFGYYGSVSSKTDYLDDVAFYMHTEDLRSDYLGEQNIMLYGIYIFGNAAGSFPDLLMQRTCINGGFDDYNASGTPDLQIEWDKDNDNIPDNYYYATQGDELVSALTSTFSDILKRTSSASAVSVVSASSRGEGTVYQALFAPVKYIGINEVNWVGTLRALWIDQQGNLREDTQVGIGDPTLHMKNDFVVSIEFNGTKTVANRYRDSDGDGIRDAYIDEVDADSSKAVWDAGLKLWNMNPDNRDMSLVSYNSSGAIGLIDLTTTNSDSLDFLLDVFGARTDTLIEYLRGTDFPGHRIRTAQSKVWKLGDIVYSTPCYISAPQDRYDLIYNDISYRDYFAKYHDRRGVVYQGANDGFLHAFNAGRYYESRDNLERGTIDDKGTYDLGEEIWAIAPFSLLPHLQALWRPNYGDDCHVYFVDNKIKAFDAPIFSPSDIHTHGWGTCLAVTQRLGGMPYKLSDSTTILSSSILVLDVTDPENPDPVWEFTDNDLGLTTVYPAIAHVDSEWFMCYGSGPTDVLGDVDQPATGYVLNLDDGTVAKKYTMDANTHCGDPVSVDVNLDRNTDVVYIGTNEHDHLWAQWGGKVYRLHFNNSKNPNNWTTSTLIDIDRPVFASGGVTVDETGNLWYFFGTGHYLSNYDEVDNSTQYFMGIKDDYWQSGGGEIYLSDLINVTNVDVFQTDSGAIVSGLPQGDMRFNELKSVVSNAKGWYLEFYNSERVLASPLILGEAVFFTTFTPNDDVCSFGGDAQLYGLYFLTGTANPALDIMGMDGIYYSTNTDIGDGVPTAPTAHVGAGDKITVSSQLSTGEINQEKASVSNTKSGPIFWKGK